MSDQDLSTNRLFGPEDEFVGRIHDRLARLLQIRISTPPRIASAKLLAREQLSALIDKAFWASLKFNEGRRTRVCVMVATPENFRDAVAFAQPVPYDESHIARLAPAVPSGGCLVVSGSTENLSIWGIGRGRLRTWDDPVTIDVWDPGTVRIGVGPYQPFAVLSGRSKLIIEGAHIDLAVYLQKVSRNALSANDDEQAVWRECLALADLARMIVADGHGGIILIVPGETGTWSGSLDSFAYRFNTPDTTMPDTIRLELKGEVARGEMLDRLWATPAPDDLKMLITDALARRFGGFSNVVRTTASLARVDGAIVMTRDLRVLGFGAKIAVKDDAAPRVRIFRTDPGQQSVVTSPLEGLGGTRHQSTARFIAAHRDACAVVISQDRLMSVLHWDVSDESVAVVRNAEWWV